MIGLWPRHEVSTSDVGDAEEGFRCRVRTRYGLTREINIERGTKQGCPASPGKFTLFIEMFLWWLREEAEGYLMEGKDREKKAFNAVAFMDDITLISHSHEGLQRMVDKLRYLHA